MKKINYIVEVEFEDHINDDNEINEVGNNILGAISTAVNYEGLVQYLHKCVFRVTRKI